jgi:hypothetical protein
MNRKFNSEKILEFIKNLNFLAELPEGIQVINPFSDSNTMETVQTFYRRFYSDETPRRLILGINPGRFGAGVTGITFTDTKRLKEKCGIETQLDPTYEPSSVFVYEVIDSYGGVEKFYSHFLVSAVCPLGFVKQTTKGAQINYNYYDNRQLLTAVTPFIEDSIQKHLGLGVYSDVCFCLGTGKNYQFLSKLNEKHRFFEKIIALEHPRFIMQYKSKEKNKYLKKYLDTLA